MNRASNGTAVADAPETSGNTEWDDSEKGIELVSMQMDLHNELEGRVEVQPRLGDCQAVDVDFLEVWYYKKYTVRGFQH